MYKVGFYGGKFMPFHRGHLNCIIRAASQCEKLYVIMMYNGEEELEILSHPTIFGNENLTPHLRELALRKELNCFPNIEVIAYDSKPADDRAKREGKHGWYYECQDMIELMGEFDVCYSSEPQYDKWFKYYYPFAESIVFDAERELDRISGTAIRNMSFAQAYSHLPRAYQQLINKTVLCVGTCSCGKTTTVRKLASYFNTSFSQEQGRLVSESFKNVSSPGYEFYNQFLAQQYMDNVWAKQEANMVAILDTDAAITKFYCDLYEEGELPAAQGLIQETDFDLILYFEPTVPFVEDGMRTKREAEQRWELSNKLRKVYLDRFGDKVKILDGNYESNYMNSVRYIKELLGM